jgi:N4-(beta-N-acetylglucosaminyl)-L-asparaginase
MEDTPHNMLAGQGADEFAIRKGFSRELLLNEAGIKDYYDRKARINDKDLMPGHDTVGVVALDCDGNMACGTSTSGLAMKYRGRVGDSPLIGSGFYVDNNWGGACCTGVGEDIMRGCMAFSVINGLQQGMTPDDAAIEAIRNTHTRIDNGIQPVGKMALVCADKYGNYGASSNHSSFEYCIAAEGMEPSIVKVEAIKGLGLDTV